MCCEPTGYDKKEIDGVCVWCGEDTVDGSAFERCAYSPERCVICGHTPCDESC